MKIKVWKRITKQIKSNRKPTDQILPDNDTPEAREPYNNLEGRSSDKSPLYSSHCMHKSLPKTNRYPSTKPPKIHQMKKKKKIEEREHIRERNLIWVYNVGVSIAENNRNGRDYERE